MNQIIKVSLLAFVNTTHVLLKRDVRQGVETLDLPGVRSHDDNAINELLSSLNDSLSLDKNVEFKGAIINIINKLSSVVEIDIEFLRYRLSESFKIDTHNYIWMPIEQISTDTRTKRSGKIIDYIINTQDRNSILRTEENQLASWNDAELTNWTIERVDKT